MYVKDFERLGETVLEAVVESVVESVIESVVESVVESVYRMPCPPPSPYCRCVDVVMVESL